MSQERRESLLDIGGFVGTPIDGWPTHGEPAPDRVDVYRPDPLTHNIVDGLCDGLLMSVNATSTNTDVDWQSPVTVKPEQFPVQVYRNGRWVWTGADRPSHFTQFVSTHRLDPTEDGWQRTTPNDVQHMSPWELEAHGAMADYTLTAPIRG